MTNNSYRCHSCGSDDLSVLSELSRALKNEWELSENSYIHCDNCGMNAPIKDFVDKPPKPPFEVPNLDDMTDDPRELNELAEVFQHLSYYASLAATAKARRQRGDIKRALEVEKDMEHYYSRLPEWARW